jgi:hypothetical protein
MLVIATSACAPHERASLPEVPSRSEARRTVVLVAIDGVRWQDVFFGVDADLAERFGLSAEERLDAAHLVPNLQRLMRREGAAIGAPDTGEAMRASGPNFVSLPGYMEMLTGRSDTGCPDNQCQQVTFSTVADDVASARLGDAVVVSSWTGVGRAATAFDNGPLVSVGRHGGSDRARFEEDPEVARLLADGAEASPEPGYDDFRPDAHTAKIALAYLASGRPGFLFVGLGETDEYGHRNDYRAYLRALHDADRTIGVIAAAVLGLAKDGHPATLLVTTDHGRSTEFSSHGGEYPESSRVFLVAAGSGILARGLVPARFHRLADLGQTIRALVDLPLVKAPRAGEVISELFVRTPNVARAL